MLLRDKGGGILCGCIFCYSKTKYIKLFLIISIKLLFFFLVKQNQHFCLTHSRMEKAPKKSSNNSKKKGGEDELDLSLIHFTHSKIRG